jgi:hypothetical protein
MEKNPALALLRILRHRGANPVTDAELRKLSGYSQTELDIDAEELESEGMLEIECKYTLTE